MSEEQLRQAAQIYLFDMLVQNPDRRTGNENCFVVHGSLAAIDFADCFSFLYSLFGAPTKPWEVDAGISDAHVFRGTLSDSAVDWTVLLDRLKRVLDAVANEPLSWMPKAWSLWRQGVQGHLIAISEHFDEFRWEILRSVS